jgi:hypothetical protein
MVNIHFSNFFSLPNGGRDRGRWTWCIIQPIGLATSLAGIFLGFIINLVSYRRIWETGLWIKGKIVFLQLYLQMTDPGYIPREFASFFRSLQSSETLSMKYYGAETSLKRIENRHDSCCSMRARGSQKRSACENVISLRATPALDSLDVISDHSPGFLPRARPIIGKWLWLLKQSLINVSS